MHIMFFCLLSAVQDIDAVKCFSYLKLDALLNFVHQIGRGMQLGSLIRAQLLLDNARNAVQVEYTWQRQELKEI